MLHHTTSFDERDIGSQTSLDFVGCSYDKDYDTTASSSDDLQDKPIGPKTMMYRVHGETGKCESEAQCAYAHSLEELLKQPQTLRTEQCPSYHRRLGCMLGRDCSFAHCEKPLSDIVSEQRRNQRFRLLQ